MYNDDFRINRTLRKIMIDRRMGVDDIAASLGKAKQSISTTLTRTNNPTISTIEDIAGALGYDINVSFIDRQTGQKIEC